MMCNVMSRLVPSNLCATLILLITLSRLKLYLFHVTYFVEHNKSCCFNCHICNQKSIGIDTGYMLSLSYARLLYTGRIRSDHIYIYIYDLDNSLIRHYSCLTYFESVFVITYMAWLVGMSSNNYIANGIARTQYFDKLTNCGLVTPFGVTDPSQHWYR